MMKQPEPDPDRSTVRYGSALVRSLRTNGWNLSFVGHHDVWVTVELSDTYKVEGSACGRQLSHAASIGAVHITPPGEKLDLKIIGDYRAVQFAVPIDSARAIASEDLEVDETSIYFHPLLGAADAHLVKCSPTKVRKDLLL
jgi:hypothetical protein